MPVVRRFVVVQALLLWQGGFVFYAAVVVPIATDHLGSAREQGLVTRRVTPYLNAAGGLCLAALAWDQFACRPCRRSRWATWTVSAVGLVALVVLYRDLDAGFDDRDHLRDRPGFRFWHGVYLSVSTGHWLLALAQLALCLTAWRRQDRENADAA